MAVIAEPRVVRRPFGLTRDGRAVDRFLLEGAAGFGVEVIEHGAAIRSLCVPDRTGRLADVALGYPELAGYEADRFFLGAVVGRFAGRIRGGSFELDGERHQLTRNGGEHHLHGGARGLDRGVWQGTPFVEGDAAGVTLRHVSPHGEEGYPGTLEVAVTYTIGSDSTLRIEYRAETDRPTPVNLTQHSYFNLAGEGSGDVLGHELTVHADAFAELGEDLVPTGRLLPVAGTPLDFRSPRPIREAVESGHPQVRIAGGCDHTYVLRGTPAARLVDPVSGRTLDVHTTLPALQVYSANFLDGSLPAKRGRRYGARAGLCLEAQQFPDAPNQPSFPSAILRPGEVLRARTELRFGVLP